MGDNIYLGDRNGVRTPMQWSARPERRLLPGKSQKLLPADHHRPGIPLRSGQRGGAAEQPEFAALVDEAGHRPAQAFKAFGRGTIEFLHPGEPQVLAFLRRSRTRRSWWWRTFRASTARGARPVRATRAGPRGACWADRVPGDQGSVPRHARAAHLLLVLPRESRQRGGGRRGRAPRPGTGRGQGRLDRPVPEGRRGTLEAILPAYLRNRRWFGGKSRGASKWARVVEAIPVADGTCHLHLLLVQVDYTEGDPEIMSSRSRSRRGRGGADAGRAPGGVARSPRRRR